MRLRTLLGRAVLYAVLGTALIAVSPQLVPSRGTDPAAVRMQSGNTVLFDHRDTCWVGDRPSWAPEYPGHVVMRVEDGVSGGGWFYGGPRYVDIALNDVFTKDNPRVFVKAFCS